jgi:2'-5' RNA ligase
VVPPAEVVAQIAQMDRPARPGLRWTGRDQWHLTLRFFASVDPDGLVAALAAVPPGRVTARCGPHPLALSRRVWALPVAGLDGLAAAVATATAGMGPPDARPFRGHLTLARARQPAALAGLPAAGLSSEWEVAEIVAVRSELGRDGARHTPIYRHAL